MSKILRDPALLNPDERDALVHHMSNKYAHVSSLRKYLKTKIRRRHLRGSLLLHMCTFILIALYLQELVSNINILDANLGMLNFIEKSTYTKTTRYSHHKIQRTIKEVGDINDIEDWTREIIVNKMLVKSTPNYRHRGGSALSTATAPAPTPTANGASGAPQRQPKKNVQILNNVGYENSTEKIERIRTREFYGKYLLLWGVRLRQIRVSAVERKGLFANTCLVYRKTRETFYDIDYSMDSFGNRKYGWLTSTCYPEWSNVLSSFIEARLNFTRDLSANDVKETYQFKYYSPPEDDPGADVNQNTPHNSYPRRGWVVDFLVNEKNSLLERFDKTISKQKFFDEQTRAAIVEFTTYLPTTGVFTSVRIFFETGTTGDVKITPIVTSARFSGLQSVTNVRLITGLLLTVINVWNMYTGLQDFAKSCGAKGEFVVYGWDVIKVVNELLMLMLVANLWNELFIEGNLKEMKTNLNVRDHFVDSAYLLRKQAEQIQTFAVNAFLVTIRFLQFFKLSPELKFVWHGVKISVSQVSNFAAFVMLPCLLCTVASGYVSFGSHVESLNTFQKAFVSILRLTFKDDSFAVFFEQLTTSVLSHGLIALFLCAVAIMYLVIIFSFLQGTIFESWQSLYSTKQRKWTLREHERNEDYFTRYLAGFIKLPGSIIMNALSVSYWTTTVPGEIKRIFGSHVGTPESNVSWHTLLEALEDGKLQTPSVSFAVLTDALITVTERKKSAGDSKVKVKKKSESGGSGGGGGRSSGGGSSGGGDSGGGGSGGGAGSGENILAFHVAVAFAQIEFIGAVWNEEQMDKYTSMDASDQHTLNRHLNQMARTHKRIELNHLSYGLSREEALAATQSKMEELNPYSQQGYKRGQLRHMMSRLNRLNQESIADSNKLNEQLDRLALAHANIAAIIAGIGKDLDGIDPGTSHDTSVAVQVTDGDKDAAMKINVLDSSSGNSKFEVLEYDSTW